jgi:hypothetical protein
MRGMTPTEHTSYKRSDDPYESDSIPGLGLGWPQWVVEHLIKLFKRVTASH